MNVGRPEKLWVSDITYLGNRKEPYYLALVTDAYSKTIVGYDVSAILNIIVDARSYWIMPVIIFTSTVLCLGQPILKYAKSTFRVIFFTHSG